MATDPNTLPGANLPCHTCGTPLAFCMSGVPEGDACCGECHHGGTPPPWECKCGATGTGTSWRSHYVGCDTVKYGTPPPELAIGRQDDLQDITMPPPHDPDEASARGVAFTAGVRQGVRLAATWLREQPVPEWSRIHGNACEQLADRLDQEAEHDV